MLVRPYKANLTFEDECSKGGEDVISRIFERRIICWGGAHTPRFFFLEHLKSHMNHICKVKHNS